MTLYWCEEILDERTGSQSVLTSPSGAVRPKYEMTRKYKARSNSKAETPESVRVLGQLLGLPFIFDSHPDQPAALVQSIEPRLTDPPYLWTIDVKYSSEVGDETRSDDSPLNEPTEISFSFQKYQTPLVRDKNNDACINSANEPFDPPIEVDDSRPLLTFTRNEGGFDLNLPLTYKDAVNSDNFFGFAQKQVKVGNIQAVSQYRNGIAFWRVTYEFEIRYNNGDGWRLKVLDQGTRYLDANSKPQNITDGSGLAVSKPVLLNGAGKVLYPIGAQTGAKTTINMANNFAIPDLTLVVTDSSVFGPVPFTVRVDSEEMLVTAVNGQSLTVVRAQNFTTAAGHNNGASVQQQPVYLEFVPYFELPFAALALP